MCPKLFFHSFLLEQFNLNKVNQTLRNLYSKGLTENFRVRRQITVKVRKSAFFGFVLTAETRTSPKQAHSADRKGGEVKKGN